jgi:hypothetical protein
MMKNGNVRSWGVGLNYILGTGGEGDVAGKTHLINPKFFAEQPAILRIGSGFGVYSTGLGYA